LLLGDRHGALVVLLAEQALRRRRNLDVEVRTPETAAQARYDGLR
jgi:hypothetical protein